MPRVSKWAFTGPKRRGLLIKALKLLDQLEKMDEEANAHNAAGKLPQRRILIEGNFRGSFTAVRNRIDGALRQFQLT